MRLVYWVKNNYTSIKYLQFLSDLNQSKSDSCELAHFQEIMFIFEIKNTSY